MRYSEIKGINDTVGLRTRGTLTGSEINCSKWKAYLLRRFNPVYIPDHLRGDGFRSPKANHCILGRMALSSCNYSQLFTSLVLYLGVRIIVHDSIAPTTGMAHTIPFILGAI